MRTFSMVVCVWLGVVTAVLAQEPRGQLRVIVTSDGQPVAGATVVTAGRSAETGADGVAQFDATAGTATVTATKDGFAQGKAEALVTAGQMATVEIELAAQLEVEEEVVVVASTRTGRRLEEQPTRVEVIGREEIEEKLLKTPGDIVMTLNEMGGLRVQATSPSIGAASVRVQGMKGRYTRFLSDGLPLFGQRVGSLGMLQIPPMDLGQAEVIKGVASAFYGAGAMGGVVNLLARRPGDAPTYDALLNVSSLGATDAVVFLSTAAREGWSASVLAGGHGQVQNDRDDDGWADLAGYRRGILRPRAFWDGGNGRSAFRTAGVTWEDRDGGTMDGAVHPATGAAYREALDTRATTSAERHRRSSPRGMSSRSEAPRPGSATPIPSVAPSSGTVTPTCLARSRSAAPPEPPRPGSPERRTNRTPSHLATCPSFPTRSTCPRRSLKPTFRPRLGSRCPREDAWTCTASTGRPSARASPLCCVGGVDKSCVGRSWVLRGDTTDRRDRGRRADPAPYPATAQGRARHRT